MIIQTKLDVATDYQKEGKLRKGQKFCIALNLNIYMFLSKFFFFSGLLLMVISCDLTSALYYYKCLFDRQGYDISRGGFQI